VNVYSEENAIEVEDDAGAKSKISYDCLIIATGASMVGPWRADDDIMPSMAERDADVKEFREKLKAAKSILCIGAGATGCESACYIKETWPDKKVGICQRGNVMMPDITGAHSIILDYITKVGVTYHNDTSFKEGEGVANEYEAHVDCRGFRFDGPKKYMHNEMAECIDGKTG
jgi:pyruvate/2-oxoglutarate dehydrogenase complex dihydrolipoamide dehydrogenase (E3) component